MDQAIRNRLRNVVTQCRKLLEEAVSQVLQGQFGIYASGKKDAVHVEDESRMTNLSDEDKGYRRDIQAHLGHIQALGYKPKDALAQLVREIAFTHLNRLCAYKMMEAREVWVGGHRFREAVSRGMKSQGFQFYLADHGDDKKLFDAGHQDVAYRHFLGWLGALLSEEIGVLFSPTDPANRLFPPQRVLDDVLDLLNSDDLKDIWTEDETIGWVYQYFTPKELRDQARKESAAPRNSYELAFRNQFFTPRYVVEFLTDNTLGRIWCEMRKGDTKLLEQCRYMVRRPSEVFLAEGQSPPEPTQNQEELSQEELLQQPVHIPHRPKKDPRELHILDPACGSGHFLLYCFDLFLTIYEEAYADPDIGPKLKEEYPTLEALRRDVPRLILAHDLHGIDIDLRCTQIAALALWLRCQRAYREMGLKQDRPKITKSNIVCAEPMPGEMEMLKEFVAELQPKVLGHFVEVVFDKMKLSGEAGSLLKIEEELRDAIADVKKKWIAETEQATDRKGQPLLFTVAEMDRLSKKTPQPQLFDFSEITDEQFWNEAENHVLAALRTYSTHATNGGKLKRQLFADDAAQGFAFIDLCQKRFDVVLMNPPFGDVSKPCKNLVERTYPRTKNDMYAAFVERGLGLLQCGGMLGAITSRTGFFLSSYQKWREDILLKEARPSLVADLGFGVLDTALVETAAYCLAADQIEGHTTFIKLLHYAEKGEALLDAVQRHRDAPFHQDICVVDPKSFHLIPGSPFSYWVSNAVRRLFRDLPALESEERHVRQGLATADDFRFVRLWWEVPPDRIVSGSAQTPPGKFRQQTFDGKRWASFAKGGEYSPFYADLHLVVNWENDGEAIRSFKHEDTGRTASRPQNTEFYFRPGLTWPRRSTSGFGVRVLQAGAVFADKGPACFTPEKKELATLGILFSQSFQRLIEMSLAAGEETQSGTAGRSYEVGTIQRLPWPNLTETDFATLTTEVRCLVECVRESEVFDETGKLFYGPIPLLASCIRVGTYQWQRHREYAQLRALERAVIVENTLTEKLFNGQSSPLPQTTGDARSLCSLPDDNLPEGFNEVYCRSIHETIREELDEEGGNRQIAVKSFYVSRHLEILSQTLGVHPRRIIEAAAEQHLLPDGLLESVAEGLMSYCMGCVLGRWDVRFATGKEKLPELPDPFAPLPPCSLGMLQGPDGLPLRQLPGDYPLGFSLGGIIPDDPDHSDDIVRRVREVLELIWRDRAEAIEKEACEILGLKELRDYFRKPGKGGFWDDHVSRYSKSRRMAPIYWLLQSSKKNYALWLYYHRLDKDILFKARQNYVEPKIRLEQSRLDSLRSQKSALGAAAKGARKIDKEIERQEALLGEINDFAEKLERAAKLNFGDPAKLNSEVVYDPDLNDGVVLTIAPLWELVSWKEARKYWEELLEGKYEWSSMGNLLRKKGLVK